MIREIVEWPDKILTRRSLPTGPGDRLDTLVEDMVQTLYHAGGCGLAAVQVGVPVRVFVIDIGNGPETFLNPEWTPWRGTKTVLTDEGCLSVPAPKRFGGKERYFRALVPRYERINVSYMTQKGSMLKGQFRGLMAQAYQHEADHLDGKLLLAEKLEASTK